MLVQTVNRPNKLPLFVTGLFAVVAVGFIAAALWAMFGGGRNDEVELGTVTGRVTKKGQPQANVWVQFEPVRGGRGSDARTDRDGRYELRYTGATNGALVGKHRAKISAGGEIGEGGGYLNPPQQLAEREVVVQSGDNELNFELAEKQ